MRMFSLITTSAVIILIILLATSKIGDPDTVQYLASGRYIVEHGLPASCVYTYTLTRCITVYSEWFLHLLVYVVYRLAGWVGLSLFTAGVISTTFLTILIYNIRHKKVNMLLTAAVLLLAAFAASGRFVLRADTVALLPMVLYFVLLNRAFDKEYFETDRPMRIWFFAGLFAIQLFWTNVHGSFPLAIAIAAAFLLPDVVRAIVAYLSAKKVPKSVSGRLRLGIAVVAVTFAASIINPYGPRAFLWPFTNTADTMGKELVSTISEYQSAWEPRDFAIVQVQAYKLLVYFTAVILLLGLRRGRVSDYVVVFLLFWMSLQGTRYIAAFAVVAAAVTPSYLERIIRSFSRILFTKSARRKLEFISLFFLGIALLGMFIEFASSIIDNTYYMNMVHSRRFGLGKSDTDYPDGAVQFIKDKNIPGNMFNSYGFGGYLNWALFPQYKTFIHGAVLDFDIVDTVWLYKYYLQLNTTIVPYREAVKRFGINFFLLNHTSDTAADLISALIKDPQWKLIYLDHTALIFIADTLTNQELIKTHAIDFKNGQTRFNSEYIEQFAPFDRAYAYNSLGIQFSKFDLPDAARWAYERSLANYESFVALSNLGNIYSRLGLVQEAEKVFQRSIALEDNFAPTHNNYATFLFRQKQLDQALEEYEKTLSINNNYTQAKRQIELIQAIKKVEKGEL